MAEDNPRTPRTLQQQPARAAHREQQRGGATEFQQQQAGQSAQGGRPQQMGEGSYEATRDYQKNIRNYLDKADVQADAQAARPRSEAEARALEAAEREARSHSRGER